MEDDPEEAELRLLLRAAGDARAAAEAHQLGRMQEESLRKHRPRLPGAFKRH